MLCCVGLIGGMAVGQYLGGPWTFIAPAAGFGIGLVGDMKFMKGMHKKGGQRQHDTGPRTRRDADPVCGMEVDESKAEHQAMHKGKTYFFCARGCKQAFEENPEKYIGRYQAMGDARKERLEAMVEAREGHAPARHGHRH
jgi:YHS domain-containing protein